MSGGHAHPHDHRPGPARGNGHGHHHGTPKSNTRLGIAAALNVGFAVIQVTVGLIIGSIVVLADALHQVVDAVGLITALAALVLLRRPASGSMTYGWGKADALGAYTSALLLIGSIAWVAYESIHRLVAPVPIDGGPVVLVGLAGIAVNGLSIFVLGAADHLSVKAAKLHLLVDLAGSVIVVLAGLVLAGTGLNRIDPLASLAINLLVLRSTWSLLHNAGAELLDRSPVGTTAAHISDFIRSAEGVADVHHVHTRSIGPGVSSVTAHVVMDGTVTLHAAQEQMAVLQHELAERLGIEHSTIQLECHNCADADH